MEVFEGGHTWLPIEMATSGVEWMEIQAMKNGLRSRTKRSLPRSSRNEWRVPTRSRTGVTRMRELKQIAADFESLRDVATVVESAAALEGREDVAAALNAEQAEDARESAGARAKSTGWCGNWVGRKRQTPRLPA